MNLKYDQIEAQLANAFQRFDLPELADEGVKVTGIPGSTAERGLQI